MPDPQPPAAGTDLDADRILHAFHDAGVRAVVVGGWAIERHGIDYTTQDIDLTPALDQDNMTRVSAALRDLGARVRTEGLPGGLPFSHDATSLTRVSSWNLTSDAGDFDLVLHPAGTNGYDDLIASAHDLDWHGITIHIAALDDIIRSKEAAGRDKDYAALPALYAARTAHSDRSPTQDTANPAATTSVMANESATAQAAAASQARLKRYRPADHYPPEPPERRLRS